MNREAELWAMALWVEHRHGEASVVFIDQEIARNAAAGAPGGVRLWQAVRLRHERLTRSRSSTVI